MSQKSRPYSRRTFIKNMALMGGAGAVMAGPARTICLGSRENQMGSPDARRSQGYRITPHIRKYYKKAAS